MGDELEPLTESDDPFVILGVDPAADDRELRRAYARRIKVYRPDRAPDAFARIHAAFEVARAHAGQAAARTIPPPTAATAAEAPPRPPPPTSSPAPTDARRQFSEAVAAGDDAAAHAAWARVRAGGSTLEALLLHAPQAEQTWLLDHASLPWRELSMWAEPQLLYAAWMTAFASRVKDPARMELARALVTDADLHADAPHDPVAGLLLLSAISSLAWRDLDLARELLRGLRFELEHPLVDRMYDRATIDVEHAGREYRFYDQPALPPLMFELLADAPLMSPPDRADLELRLRDSLALESDDYLRQFTDLVQNRTALSEALAARLLDGVPEHRRELAAMPPGLVRKLGKEMKPAAQWTWWLVSLVVVVLGLWLAVPVSSLIENFDYDYQDDEARENAKEFAFALTCGAGFVALLGVEWLIYRFLMRARFARVLARVGVTRAALKQWSAASWLRFRTRRFNGWLERDHALRLVGMLAANVAEEREP